MESANARMLWLFWRIGNYVLAKKGMDTGWDGTKMAGLMEGMHADFPGLQRISVPKLGMMAKFAQTYSGPVLRLLADATTNGVLPCDAPVSVKSSTGGEEDPRAMEITFLDSIVARVSWEHHTKR